MNITSFVRHAFVATALAIPALCMAMTHHAAAPMDSALGSAIPGAAQTASVTAHSCGATMAPNPFGIFGAESGDFVSARDANYYNCRCCTAFGWPDCCAKCH